MIDLLVLGVGAGASHILHNVTSSSFAIMKEGECLLLVDMGLGVTRTVMKHTGKIPDQVYISHNHLDHSGELPVTAQIKAKEGNRLRVLSAPEVERRIKDHRLDEIKGSGVDIETLINWQTLDLEDKNSIDSSMSIIVKQGQHSEECYGFKLYYEDQEILAYSADSGYNEAFYEWLSTAPVLILDGRSVSSYDHASFQEIKEFENNLKDKKIYVTHYGTKENQPSNLRGLIPGEIIKLA